MTIVDHPPAAADGHSSVAAAGPGWLREFASTLSVHSQFVFHGNVHDQFLTADGTQLTSLPALLWGVLRPLGFTGLITYDQVAGIGVYPERGDGARAAALLVGKPTEGVESERKLSELRDDLKARRGGRGGPLRLRRRPRLALTVAQPHRAGARREGLLRLLREALAHRDARTRRASAKPLYNPIIWLAERPGDLPPWLTAGNDGIREIAVPRPHLGDRQQTARLLARAFETADPDAVDRSTDDFAAGGRGADPAGDDRGDPAGQGARRPAEGPARRRPHLQARRARQPLEARRTCASASSTASSGCRRGSSASRRRSPRRSTSSSARSLGLSGAQAGTRLQPPARRAVLRRPDRRRQDRAGQGDHLAGVRRRGRATSAST